MIDRLVLLGATGDLAGRFLLPALATLQAAGQLPEGFQMVGAATANWDDETFRRHAAQSLQQHAADLPAAGRAAFARSWRYRPVDLADQDTVARVLDGDAPAAVYLALPTNLLPVAVTAIRGVGLPPGSRIAVEKPFGQDLDSAVELNALLATASGDAGEQAVFRVDHVLGMATVQNLLALPLANRVLEPLWNSRHIEQVAILWEETLALEDRSGYYDRAGALKDVVQNHMLQVLSLVAMEPPTALDARQLRDHKLDALRSVRPLTPSEVLARTRRARYTAGRLAGTGGASDRLVPDYAEEDGVDPERGTETFAEIVLDLDSPRWAGTHFVLRAGKALNRRRKGVVVRFRPVSQPSFAATELPANQLWIGLDGPTDLSLHLTGGTPSLSLRPVPLTMTGQPPESEVPPYGRVLLDILKGGSALSVGGDEAEQAWRVLTPVLDAWDRGTVPLEEYPAGSAGPRPQA